MFIGIAFTEALALIGIATGFIFADPPATFSKGAVMGGVILMETSGGNSPLGPLLPEVYDLVWSLVIFAVILFVVVRFGVPR